MQRVLRLLLAVAILAALPWPLQAQSPRSIRVVMTSYKFEPNRIELTAGERVILQLVNEDREERNHNLDTSLFAKALLTVSGEIFAVKDLRGTLHSSGVDLPGVLFVAVAPGKMAQVELTVPEAGSYSFVCSIPGHTPRGMTGAFSVLSPP